MTRGRTVLVVAVFVSIPLAMGCEPGDEESRESLEQPAELDEGEETGATDDEIEEVAGDAGRALTTMLYPKNDANKIDCQCGYEEAGFDSEEECLDRMTRTEEELQKVTTCLTERVEEISREDFPDEQAREYFDCLESDIIPATRECIDSLGDDVCAPASRERLRGCLMSLGEEHPECIEIRRENEWLSTHHSEFDECFSQAHELLP